MEGECEILDAALDTLDDVFYVFDADGQLLHWNARFNDLFDLSDSELAGAEPMEFIVESDHSVVEEAVSEVFETGETVVEAQAETTGGLVTFELTGRLLRDDGGTVVGFSGTGRDVTERRDREWHLLRQNKRLTEFADLLVHDLRTPLSVASGRLHLASETAEAEHLRAAKRGLERMEAIIEDIRTATREGTLATDREPVDIDAVARDAWAHVETDAATLKQPTTLIVTADETRLLRLFENLFRNAIDHGGESVTVRVEPTAQGFAVEDDGRGIDPSDRDWVFEPGASDTADGTGFGLYIVRTIAEAHGWTVCVTDSADGGARFEFDLGGDA